MAENAFSTDIDTLALGALWPRAFDMRFIMVDGHDLSIVCYTYVKYNKSSRVRAHNSILANQFLQFNSIPFPIKLFPVQLHLQLYLIKSIYILPTLVDLLLLPPTSHPNSTGQ